MNGRFTMHFRNRSETIEYSLNPMMLLHHRQARRLHRLVVPMAAIPLALTTASGAIYGTALSVNIDVPWLLRLHTGNFGLVNLQPVYSPLVGIMSLLLIVSGVSLLRNTRGARPASTVVGPEGDV
jgi:hypothetical protein